MEYTKKVSLTYLNRKLQQIFLMIYEKKSFADTLQMLNAQGVLDIIVIIIMFKVCKRFHSH